MDATSGAVVRIVPRKGRPSLRSPSILISSLGMNDIPKSIAITKVYQVPLKRRMKQEGSVTCNFHPVFCPIFLNLVQNKRIDKMRKEKKTSKGAALLTNKFEVLRSLCIIVGSVLCNQVTVGRERERENHKH